MGLPTEKKILRKAEAGNGPYDGDNNDVKGSWLVQSVLYPPERLRLSKTVGPLRSLMSARSVMSCDD
ncbi:hypothetical protein AXG93_2369s1010 [Marchantia polymorpha subsp. ruderalis]|uniref:Uncharacterized protein n=1 Tax=Marchantia polymorpha subsp. ruderalis TaxID=1480154 RepID=A0A176W769_MARPO|nr:hypothetical protein AXG93_2369s1010 [Marchantia polymorpha subsp. ruderalis]